MYDCPKKDYGTIFPEYALQNSASETDTHYRSSRYDAKTTPDFRTIEKSRRHKAIADLKHSNNFPCIQSDTKRGLSFVRTIVIIVTCQGGLRVVLNQC